MWRCFIWQDIISSSIVRCEVGARQREITFLPVRLVCLNLERRFICFSFEISITSEIEMNIFYISFPSRQGLHSNAMRRSIGRKRNKQNEHCTFLLNVKMEYVFNTFSSCNADTCRRLPTLTRWSRSQIKDITERAINQCSVRCERNFLVFISTFL